MNISIIGIGRLGLCAALTMESRGFNVLGVDRRVEYVNSINEKTLHSLEPQVDEYLRRSINFTATTDLRDAVVHSDILMVMVATPSLRNGFYDHRQIERVVRGLAEIGNVGLKQFVICCTVTPGYANGLQKRIQKYGYAVSYNPEFIAQGNVINGLLKPDMVLVGTTHSSSKGILSEVYKKWCVEGCPTNCMDLLSAEICKIALNCFITTKIAYANMVGDLANAVGADHYSILNAIGDDTRIGHKCMGFGHGFGGPCFPRDNRAFAKYCRENGVIPFISEATDRSNRKHLDYFTKFQSRWMVKNIEATMDVGYKRGSSIVEESQQLLMAARLAKMGYKIRIRNCPGIYAQVKKKYGNLFVYDRHR